MLWVCGVGRRGRSLWLGCVASYLQNRHQPNCTGRKIAIFCDGEFWHGKDWESKKGKIRSNRDYWEKKIERNICRDIEVNRVICGSGWTVLRFWGNEISSNLAGCVEEIKETIF